MILRNDCVCDDDISMKRLDITLDIIEKITGPNDGNFPIFLGSQVID
jgi:hypothetical protein